MSSAPREIQPSRHSLAMREARLLASSNGVFVPTEVPKGISPLEWPLGRHTQFSLRPLGRAWKSAQVRLTVLRLPGDRRGWRA